MKKLVIEIDLDSVDGQRGDVLGLLSDMAHGIANYPHDDLRTEEVNGMMSTRFTEAGPRADLTSANVVASLDVVEGELTYTNVSKEYHRRDDTVAELLARLTTKPEK